jgi:hypothetical protein
LRRKDRVNPRDWNIGYVAKKGRSSRPVKQRSFMRIGRDL